jgi:hypothetical protein
MAHVVQKRLKRSRHQPPAASHEVAVLNQNIKVGGLYFNLELA